MNMWENSKCIYNNNNINDILCHLRMSSNDVSEFERFNTDLEQINYAHDYLKERKLLLKNSKIHKCNDEALKLRKQGNELFKTRDYESASKAYTKSVFYAKEIDDHLSIAYANRSAILFEKQRYKECLIDITNAERNNYPKELGGKLTIRKSKCEALISTEITNDEYNCKIPTIESKSSSIECGANCLEINRTKEYGRHVIASRDINIGEVIAIENPFAYVLLKEHFLTHCYNCLRYSYNLLPCKTCVHVGFCCEDCREIALAYHQFECPIIDTLTEKCFSKLLLVAFKIVLIVRNDKTLVDNEKMNENVAKSDTLSYQSERYKEICDLIRNHSIREPIELLRRCMLVSITYDLVKNYTNFMKDATDEDNFKILLLKHFEAASLNFHEISELIIKHDQNYESIEFGSGAYSFLSLLNHSCSPNVVRYCYGKTIVLRALKQIKQGQQILDNYGYHHALMDKNERLERLKSQYIFDCNCIACINNWPLYDPNACDGNEFNIEENVKKSLLNGDRNVAIDTLPRLITIANELDMNEPRKCVLEIQEYIKYCYALFANKRCLL